VCGAFSSDPENSRLSGQTFSCHPTACTVLLRR
jgi:hypothetical protein